MKLILTIVLIFCVINALSQNFPKDFPFSSQFHTLGSFASDGSVYLPPESPTALPYFPDHNFNNLPYQFLPPSGTKVPSPYPLPPAQFMHSTLKPNFYHDADGHIQDKDKNNIRHLSPPQSQQKIMNRSVEISNPATEKREFQSLSRIDKSHQNLVDRIDVKYSPPSLNAETTIAPANEISAIRRTTSPELQGKDHDTDHMKPAASFTGIHYVHPPNVYPSSTTEPAIPILRLSNEMDLDGSFSYEALGADQTHYVQHSRMENVGSDKEEQVVEGSYSYIGDNGQTYSVHYIADSNGFRASGDHLPVPPPIPEIIQRAIQYNLAEEAKRPPHLKSWQNNNDYEKDDIEIDKNRNLYSDKAPETFSYSYTQNNLVASASTQSPMKPITDVTKEQNKPGSGSISPQVTFSASQGAHLPSVNVVQPSLRRIFSNEKYNLPQLMNYEAESTESDEGRKAFWRWQYGLNANEVNQTPVKNSISRSIGDDDEVLINFNDMTSDQYTQMLQSQTKSDLEKNVNELEKYSHDTNISKYNNDATSRTRVFSNNQDVYEVNSGDLGENITADKILQLNTLTKSPNRFHERLNSVDLGNENKRNNDTENFLSTARTNLITRNNFLPASEIITQNYDYENSDNYNFKKIRNYESKSSTESNFIKGIDKDLERGSANNEQVKETSLNVAAISNEFHNEPVSSSSFETSDLSLLSSSSYEGSNKAQDNHFEFRPIKTEYLHDNQTTTETSLQQLINNNIFLRNLMFSNSKKITSEKEQPTIKSEQNNNPNLVSVEKSDNSPNYIDHKTRTFNEFKDRISKPVDFTEILNFVNFKNQFESNKINPKHINPFNNDIQENDQNFRPMAGTNDISAEDGKVKSTEIENKFIKSSINQMYEKPKRLIKNYKILQRNNRNTANESKNQLKRELVNLRQQNHLQTIGRVGSSTRSYLPPVFV